MGADAVVLVGFEAGGHPGMDEVALSVLIRKGIQDLTVPIIAAGAISDGATEAPGERARVAGQRE